MSRASRLAVLAVLLAVLALTGCGPAGPKEVILSDTPVAEGFTYTRDSVVFTINPLQIDKKFTKVGYSVTGLPDNWEAKDVAFHVYLPDGEELAIDPIIGGGGGSSSGANKSGGMAILKPVPAGVSELTMVVNNNFTGKAEVWKIPLAVKK